MFEFENWVDSNSHPLRFENLLGSKRDIHKPWEGTTMISSRRIEIHVFIEYTMVIQPAIIELVTQLECQLKSMN